MKKRVKVAAIATLAVSMLFAATSAFAATGKFSGKLPANQGDTEISTVARANAATTVQYFSIKITSIGTGYTHVRAWTEKNGGLGTNPNLSDPYNQVKADNTYYSVNYTTTPNKGDNVILNLDNPVNTSSQVDVSGEWSPN